MEIDTATNPAPEMEAPEVATEEPASQDYEQPETDEDEGQAPEPEIEYVDVELSDGSKVRVQKGAEDKLMMQQDYTRKTQEVAELRRTIEQQRQDVQREAQINQEMIDDVANLRAVETRLQAFQNIDWSQVDPNDVQRFLIEANQLRDAKEALSGRISSRKAEIAARHERETAAVLSQAMQVLSRPDPEVGWSGKFDAETRATLTSFGKQLGFTDQELANTTHPRMIQTLNLAMIGKKYLESQKASAARPKAPEAKPLPQVGTGKTSTAVANPDKLSPEQWVKWREKQIAKNRG